MSRARDLGSSINSTVAGKNFVINGGMDIWQRGISKLDGANAYHTADRWLLSSAPAATFSRQTTSDTTNLPFIQYCMRLQRTAGSTNTNNMNIAQSFESINSVPLAGKTVTLSFYARKGANYSATNSDITAQLVTGTGTDQNAYTVGYTGSVAAISRTAVLTTTWQRFIYTATLAANTNEIGLIFVGTQTGTAGAADFYEITGIQLEQGSSATEFSRAGGDTQGELAKCQRYYYRDTLEKHLAHVRDTNLWFITKTFPVRMRSVVSFSHNLTTKVTPGTFPGTAGQIAIYANGWVAQNATALSCSSDGGSNDHGSFYIVGFNGTLGQVGSIQSNGTSYFEWNAEL
jgi:hypothetical protein